MPTGEPKLTIQPSKRNLRRLCVMRGILAVVVLTLAAVIDQSTDTDVPWAPLLWIIGFMTVINVLVLFRLREIRPVRQLEFLANLLFDVVVLAAILYFTGGSTNPLVSYFLIPLIISATVLRPLYTWILTAVTVLLYTGLLFWYQPMSLFEGGGHSGASAAHFVGMWINFGVSALLIAWFVVRMAQTLRNREIAIINSREQGMRDEQIIGVAGIAASTAHELRTPLATMTVLTGELEEEHPETREIADEIRRQVARCDATLRKLVSTTAGSETIESASAGAIHQEVLEQWRLTKPEINLTSRLVDEAAGVCVHYDQGLVPAFLSFLNNAADASPDHVGFEVRMSADCSTVEFIIEDRGPGIAPELASRLGTSRVTTKPGGLGLGVLLSRASIERLGGQVEMFTEPGSGTRLEISLPVEDTSTDEPD